MHEIMSILESSKPLAIAIKTRYIFLFKKALGL